VSDLERRIADLETRAAHQDEVIEDLSSVLAKQWKEISDLNDKIGYLKNILQELEDGIDGAPPGDKPPPHY